MKNVSNARSSAPGVSASETVAQLVSASALRVGRMVAAELQQSEIFALQLAAIIDRETGLKSLVEALESAANTFAMLTDPMKINTTHVHTAWASAVGAEQKARAALRLARGETAADHEPQEPVQP